MAFRRRPTCCGARASRMRSAPVIERIIKEPSDLAGILSRHRQSAHNSALAGFPAEIRQIDPADPSHRTGRHFEDAARHEQAGHRYRLGEGYCRFSIFHVFTNPASPSRAGAGREGAKAQPRVLAALPPFVLRTTPEPGSRSRRNRAGFLFLERVRPAASRQPVSVHSGRGLPGLRGSIQFPEVAGRGRVASAHITRPHSVFSLRRASSPIAKFLIVAGVKHSGRTVRDVAKKVRKFH